MFSLKPGDFIVVMCMRGNSVSFWQDHSKYPTQRASMSAFLIVSKCKDSRLDEYVTDKGTLAIIDTDGVIKCR